MDARIHGRLPRPAAGGSIQSRMPFAYFQRLTRRQQAIYLESDGIVTMPLPQAPRLQPVVSALARALDDPSFGTRVTAGRAAGVGAA